MVGGCELLTPNECAAHCGTCARTIVRWATAGIGGRRLAAVRVGGRWRVTAAALDEFIAALTAAALPGEPRRTRRRRTADDDVAARVAAARARLGHT